jgi:AhpD family alkylhydroperoxidase
MRMEVKPIGSYAWYLRPFFWNQRRKYGRVLDAALLWARSPRLFLGVAILYGMIDRRRSPIEPALRSLVTVRVSQINWCAFCVDLNSATLLSRGASPEKVEALGAWRHSPLFTERERAALDYTEAVTRSDARVEDAHFERLRAHFDDDAIVELTGLIAFQNLSSKFNAALAVQPQGFCSLSVVVDPVSAAEPGERRDQGAQRPAEAAKGAASRQEHRTREQG